MSETVRQQQQPRGFSVPAVPPPLAIHIHILVIYIYTHTRKGKTLFSWPSVKSHARDRMAALNYTHTSSSRKKTGGERMDGLPAETSTSSGLRTLTENRRGAC